jgi:NitT/TauT family transport system permease protein
MIVAAVLAIWQFAPDTVVDDTLVSRPYDIALQTIAWLQDGTLADEAASTLVVVFYGLLWGGVLGVVLGLIAGMFEPIGMLLDAPVNLFFAIPKVALIPLFIVWFGVDDLQHTVYTAVVVFFFFFFASFNGVRNVPRQLNSMMSVVGASPAQKLRLLYLPASLGWIASALRIAVPYAFVSAISAEVIASRHGLGSLVKSSASTFDAAGTFAAMLTLLVLSVACSGAAYLVGGLSRWKL